MTTGDVEDDCLALGGEGNERGGGDSDGVLDQFLGVVAADLGNMLEHEHTDAGRLAGAAGWWSRVTWAWG